MTGRSAAGPARAQLPASTGGRAAVVRRRIVRLAGGGMLAAGLAACSAAGPPAAAVGASGTPIAPVTVTPVTTRPEPTAPAVTSPTPTGRPPCRQNRDWDRAETVDWLKSIVEVSTREVTVDPDDSAGTLCRTVRVQIDFWKVTFRPSGTRGAVAYEAKPASRSTVRVDGRKPVAVAAPDDLAVGNCVTAMATVSVGGSLRPAELPAVIPDITGLDPDVTFRTDRLVDYQLDGLSSRLNLVC